MRKRILIIAAPLVLTTLLAALAWFAFRTAPPMDVVLRFHAVVGEEPLVLNESHHANPGGAGQFTVRDFQFFASNIRLAGANGEYAEPDSYHLVRFDSADRGFAIVLRGVPRHDYERIELGIGVDPAANGSLAARGELDPNGRMAWTWETGYKFVLFEGTLVRGDIRDALVYHVGFDENYRPLSFPVTGEQLAARQLDFRVDVGRLFTGTATIDMATLTNVKFDRTDAALLAGNYAGMITLMSADSLAQRPR